jgi:hypothetical protein
VKPTKAFQYLSYDTWGNARDGWEVNDVSRMGIFIVADEDQSDTFLRLFDRAAKKLVMRPRYQAKIEWLDESMAELTRPNGFPIGRFETIPMEDVRGRWGFPLSKSAEVLHITYTGRIQNETGKW